MSSPPRADPYLASALFAAQVHAAVDSGHHCRRPGRGRSMPTPWCSTRWPSMTSGGSWSIWSRTSYATTPAGPSEPASRAPTAIQRPGTGPATPRSTTTWRRPRWFLRARRSCRPASAPRKDGWPSSTTPACRLERRQWDCGSGCDGIDRPWDGEATDRRLSNDRDGRVPAPGGGERAAALRGAGAGTVAGGLAALGRDGPSFSHRLAPGARRRVQSGVVRVAGMVDYSYRRPSTARGVDAFGDHADPRSARARCRHRLRHLGIDDR